MTTIEVHKTRARTNPWTWRMVAGNGQIVGNAAETFDSAGNAKRAALKIGKQMHARVWMLDGDGAKVVLREAQ